MSSDSSFATRHKPASLNEVRRAIDRFRRGDPVVIGHEGALVLALAAETLTERALSCGWPPRATGLPHSGLVAC
jgi:hypothetical protein